MTSSSGPRPYHHGALRETLVDAGFELARAGGPDAVVLRAVSRSAGVSHNAAYRHFADHDDMLRAVCERCMRALAQLMERGLATVTDPDPALRAMLRLDALGSAYVEFALNETGWFRTAFAVPGSVDTFAAGEGVGDSGFGPYDLLGRCLDELAATGVLPPERRPGAEYAAWSAVHGLAMLLTAGPLRDLTPAESQVALRTVLDTVARGL